MKMKMKKNNKVILTNEKGQSIVEFALVVPVLLLIVMGVIEFGNLLMNVNVLTGAAREGVRVAAVTNPDVDQVTSTVSNYLTSANIHGATITTAGPNANNEVVVTVQMTYTVITMGLIPGIPTSFNLIRSASMRWEG
jgi:Flp pilus assembly protein TadG